MSRLKGARLVHVFGLALLVGCVDTTPLALTDPVVGEADAAFADGSPDTPCRQCITREDGVCYPIYQNCLATELCPELIECFFEQRCYEVPKYDDRVNCAVPCITKVGVQGGAAPAIPVVLEINVCSIENCSAECPFEG